MASRKLAISVPEEVLDQVDGAARGRGMSRSGFITHVLRQVARARTDAEISRRVDELFSDPEIVREQAATANDYRRSTPHRGTGW